MLSASSLDRLLIELLSRRHGFSASELRSKASERAGRAYSLSAVYKELSKLQENGIVVKLRNSYALSLSYVLDSLHFADRLRETYFSEGFLGKLLPEPGKRERWRFRSLLRANELWNQLILAVLRRSPGRTMYAWVPHPWFALIDGPREERLHRALELSSARVRTIFGEDARLDRQSERRYRGRGHSFSFARGPFAGQSDRYLDVIGDFVITVALDGATTARISRALSIRGGSAPNDPSTIVRALTAPCGLTLTLAHDPKLARRLEKSFVEYFGPG